MLIVAQSIRNKLETVTLNIKCTAKRA